MKEMVMVTRYIIGAVSNDVLWPPRAPRRTGEVLPERQLTGEKV